MHINSAHDLLQDLTLSNKQQQAVEAYYRNPSGRYFMPVVDILLAHGAVDEARQLLITGLANHPAYSVARICLAELQFEDGEFQQSWHTLEENPVYVKNNLSADLLKLKIATVLKWNDLLYLLVAKLRKEQNLPELEKRLIYEFDRFGVKEAHAFLVDKLQKKGIRLEHVYGSDDRFTDVSENTVDSLEADEFSDEGPHSCDSISNFFVAPLWQIFDKEVIAGSESSIEDLDSLTLARVYREQGFYQKAIEVLRRLVFIAPENELLQREWIEVKSLLEEQKLMERDLDPGLADKMDEVDGLNGRLNTLNQFLIRLDDLERKKNL